MRRDRVRAGWVEWDDVPPAPMLGTVTDLDGDPADAAPTFLVPDHERGGWKDHAPVATTKSRLGFRL